jgi:hypothetical protein
MATAMQKQDGCGHVQQWCQQRDHGGHGLEGVVVETVGEAIQGNAVVARAMQEVIVAVTESGWWWLAHRGRSTG